MFNRKLKRKVEKMDKLLNTIAEAVLYNNNVIGDVINGMDDKIKDLEKRIPKPL